MSAGASLVLVDAVRAVAVAGAGPPLVPLALEVLVVALAVGVDPYVLGGGLVSFANGLPAPRALSFCLLIVGHRVYAAFALLAILAFVLFVSVHVRPLSYL